MITDIIVSAFLAGIDALTSLLPSFTFPSISNGGEIRILGNLNDVFPIFVVVNVMLLLLALRILLSTFGVVQWVYHQFWGSS